MNFCSIEDAWGDNKISDQFQKYKSVNKVCSDPQKLECSVKEKEIKPIENFINQKVEVLTCDNFINHINHCSHCYNKLHYKFNIPQKNEIINNLHNIINNNKDTIVLILIGIFIILFFKLVNNITSN